MFEDLFVGFPEDQSQEPFPTFEDVRYVLAQLFVNWGYKARQFELMGSYFSNIDGLVVESNIAIC